jgi:16S rRNA (cytosine967-C5)-methyltransferase
MKPKAPSAARAGLSRPDKKTPKRAFGQAHDAARKESNASKEATSRACASALLAATLLRRRPFDEAWAHALNDREGCLVRLSPRDRAFARLLAMTVLRRLIEIDVALEPWLARPPAQPLRNILRLGAAQLLFLGTPAHAAVAETVALAGASPKARGLVNAVLRNLARARSSGETSGLGLAETAKINTPRWLMSSWVKAYGEVKARLVAEANLTEAPLDLTVKGGPAEQRFWAERLGGAVLPNGSLRLTASGPIERLAGFDTGAWWVQDAAAAMPARLFANVEGLHIVDLCAAPGGKTAQLAAMGARVTAVEKNQDRLERMATNLKRLGLEATLVQADAAAWRPKELMDGVLLDAPCTATGTIRRHPDILHSKTPKDVAAAARLQDRLLGAAWRFLKPNGLLIYATCSLQPEENEQRIDALAAARAPLRRVPIRAEEIGAPEAAITPLGDLRTLPCFWRERGGMDGFYACRLRRF